MRDHQEIITFAGGVPSLARKLGLADRPTTVRSWWARNSISPDYWPEIERLGFATVRELAAAKPKRRPKIHAD